MAKVISVALQKGGQGKSTTAQCLSANLGSLNYRVLLVDCDSQANITYSSGSTAETTISDILSGEVQPVDAITSCKYYDLLAADEYLVNLEKSEIENTLLKEILDTISDSYDFIIIDTPPALGNLLKNAITASDYLIIPTEPRPYSLQGIQALSETVFATNPDINLLGILLIKYNPRTVLNRQIKGLLDELAENMDSSVFETCIREGIAVPESQIMQQELIDYAPKSKPHQDYMEFTKEVIRRIK